MNQDPRGNGAPKGAGRIRRGVAVMTLAEAEIGPVPPEGALVALVQVDVEPRKVAPPPPATDQVMAVATSQEIVPAAVTPEIRPRRVPAWHDDYPNPEFPASVARNFTRDHR